MAIEEKKDMKNDFLTKDLDAVFRAYFNNKMMILLLMIEHPAIAHTVLTVEKQKIFLEDLYHHFLPPGTPLKYHRAFRWLEGLLDRFPDIAPKRIYRAIRMVELVYEVFGLRLERRLEAARIEKESFHLHKKQGQSLDGGK